MPELQTDDDGNIKVSMHSTRTELDEAAQMVGVDLDPSLDKAKFLEKLAPVDGISTPQPADPQPDQAATGDVIRYLEKADGPVSMQELQKKCGIMPADMRDIIAKNPGRIVTMKKKTKFLYALNK